VPRVRDGRKDIGPSGAGGVGAEDPSAGDDQPWGSAGSASIAAARRFTLVCFINVVQYPVHRTAAGWAVGNDEGESCG